MSDRKPRDEDDDLDFSLPGEHHGAQADERAQDDDYDFSMPAPHEAEQARDAPAPAAPEQDVPHSAMHGLLAFGDGLMGNYGGELAKLATRGARYLSPEGMAGGDENDPERAQQLVDQASQEHPYAHGGGQLALGLGTAAAAGPGIAAQALAGGATSAASEYGQSHDGVAAGIAGGIGAGVSGVAAGVGALGARLLAKGPPPKINEGMLAASQRMPAALEGRAAGDATHEVSLADLEEIKSMLAQQQAPQAAPAPRGAPDPVEWLRAHGMDPHAQDLGRSQAIQPGAPTQLVRDTAAQFPGQSAPTAAANPIARASMAGPSDLTQAQHTLSPAPVMRPGGAPVPQPPPPAPIGPPTAPPIGLPTAAPPTVGPPAPAPMPPQAPPPLPAPAPAPMPAPAPPPPAAAPSPPPWDAWLGHGQQAMQAARAMGIRPPAGLRALAGAGRVLDYATDKVGEKFAAGARPNELARWGTIAGTEGAAELGGSMYRHAGGKDSAAAATSNVVNWALKRVLSSPNSGLSQQDSQALNQAMMSGDQQATASQLYNAVSKSPAFAAKYEREQKRAAGEH